MDNAALSAIKRVAGSIRASAVGSDNNHYPPQPILNDDELLAFVYQTTGIRIPDVQVCEHHSTPARAFCDAYFARSPVSVWWASRGYGGKTFLLALLSWVEAVTLRASVNILGGSGKQSKDVLDYMGKLWAYSEAPHYLLIGEPTSTYTRLTNGAKVTALMASQRSVRGGHVPRLRLDEIDEMDIKILDAASGQTMIQNGIPTQTVYSSTRQYMGGTMDTILERAGEKGFTIHQWCFRENLEPHGWLTEAEVAQKQSEITTQMWEAEYELQEPSPESRAIQTEAVKRMFRKELGEFQGALHEYIEIEPPQPEGKYTNGADWARKQDFTEILTFRLDVTPKRLVAYERTGRLDWPVMIKKFNDRCRRFKAGTKNYHDATGIGDAIAGYIDVKANDVIMVGSVRSQMLTDFIVSIENSEIEMPMIKALYAEYLFASVADVYGNSAAGHLPDGIAAGALAWLGTRHKGHTFG